MVSVIATKFCGEFEIGLFDQVFSRVLTVYTVGCHVDNLLWRSVIRGDERLPHISLLMKFEFTNVGLVIDSNKGFFCARRGLAVNVRVLSMK